MLVEEDDDDYPTSGGPRMAAIPIENGDHGHLGVTPFRLKGLLAKTDNIYRMKSRQDKLAAKIEDLFKKKREQLYHIRLWRAGITAANGFATIGNEYALRNELNSLIEKENIRLQAQQEDDPYRYQHEHERLRRIRDHVVNRRDKYDGRTVLHCAVAGGHFHLVRMLVHEFQVDVHQPSLMGRCTALHLAVERGLRTIASLLITMGAEVDVKDDQGCTPLHLARKPAVAKLLFKYHANPLLRNRYNRTALEHYMYVTEKKDLDRDLLELLKSREDEATIEMLRQRMHQNVVLQTKAADSEAMITKQDDTTTSMSKVRQEMRRKLLLGLGS